MGELLSAALERPAEERDAFVAKACGGDAALLAEVRGLLAAQSAMPGGFMDVPTVDGDATLTQGAEDRPVPSLVAPGDIVGPYKLRELIGEGGFGWCGWPSRRSRCAGAWH